MVWRTDHSYVSAAFGLARALLRSGQRDAAVRAFGAVPQTSTHHTAAAEAALRALLVDRDRDLTGADLADIDARYALAGRPAGPRARELAGAGGVQHRRAAAGRADPDRPACPARS